MGGRMQKELAPIVLFVYNRPWHTKQTVEALQKNKWAEESELFIYSDAAKNGAAEQAVSEVRDYIGSVGGFKSVTIIEREKNWGLADSIIDGVTAIVNRYGKVIVLEDDLITSSYFLTFMNESLELYKNSEDVGMVHGHIYYIKDLPELFFLEKSGCLGWGTWDRAWKEVSFDGELLFDEITKNIRKKDFDINNSYPFTKMLSDQIKGKNNSWAIRVQASFFLKKKLTFYPGVTLVQHIGFDIGTHCGGRHASDMDGRLPFGKIQAKLIDIERSVEATKMLETFFKKQNIPIWERGLRKIKRILLWK